MKSIDVATQAQISAWAQVRLGMILFDLGSGLYGFWEGIGPLSWNSITFKGNGSLIEVDFGDETSGNTAEQFTCTLWENREAGLTPDVLGTFFGETYHYRPVTVYEAWFDPDTRALAGNPIPFRRGVISNVVLAEDDNGRSYLRGTCLTRSINHTRRGWAKACDAEQRLISANDRFFDVAGVAGTTQMPFGARIDGRYLSGGSRGRPAV